MKTETLLAIVVVINLIASCTREIAPEEIRMRHHFIIKQMIENKRLSEMIHYEASRSARPNILACNKQRRRIEAWQKKYVKEQNTKNLLAFADSATTTYRILRTHDKDVVRSIETYKKQILGGKDSLAVLNLYWYVLYTEGALLENLISSMGISANYVETAFPTAKNDSIFSPGDTVLILVDVFSGIEDWKFNFDDVHCVNQNIQKDIRPTVLQLERYYLLRYIPHEKGNYLLTGQVSFDNSGYQDRLSVANEFIVK